MDRRPTGILGRALLVPAAVGALSCAGCWGFTTELPPPQAPDREVPEVGARLGPPPPGRTWVVLDTPGDNAEARVVSGVTEGDEEVFHRLCATPCVTDLRPGMRSLTLRSASTGGASDRLEVSLGSDPLVIRHVMSRRTPGSGAGIAFGVLGGLGLLAGAIVAPIGVAESSNPYEADEGQRLETAGIATLGTSAALIGIALLVGYAGRGSHRAGVTTEWTIPRAAGPARQTSLGGAPVLLRF